MSLSNENLLFATEVVKRLRSTSWALAKQCVHIVRNGASMLPRIRFGKHYLLFQNGFPVTARLAWKLSLPGDPDLWGWLSDEAFYAEHGNGVMVFAPKLLLRAKSVSRQFSLPKLNGVLRWRHAANAHLLVDIQGMLSGLQQCARRVSVASGCGEVELGHQKLAAAHLNFVSVTLDPFDEQAVRAVLCSLGWLQSGDYWYRRPVAAGCGSIILIVRRSVSKQLRSDHDIQPDSREGLIHLQGPALALELARMAMAFSSMPHAGQLLDQVQGILTSQVNVAAFKSLAMQRGCGRAANQTVQLLERLCGGVFLASLPASDKDSRCTE